MPYPSHGVLGTASIRAHPQGCFMCYGRNKGFNHDHQACPIQKANTETYKKVHG